MPSAFSAQDNKSLIAHCVACKAVTATALMISLTGSVGGSPTYSSVCLSCARTGWRPPGFTGPYNRGD